MLFMQDDKKMNMFSIKDADRNTIKRGEDSRTTQIATKRFVKESEEVTSVRHFEML
jgi:hypothetical protein